VSVAPSVGRIADEPDAPATEAGNDMHSRAVRVGRVGMASDGAGTVTRTAA